MFCYWFVLEFSWIFFVFCSPMIGLQDISAVAKAWEDSPYLFIVKMQPLFRGVDEDEAGVEQLNFAFTSKILLRLKRRRRKWCCCGGMCQTHLFFFPQWKLRWRDPMTTPPPLTGPWWWCVTTDRPLMLINEYFPINKLTFLCLRKCVKAVRLLIFWSTTRKYNSPNFFPPRHKPPSLLSVAVLHGHVHRLRSVWRPLAALVRLLLEGPAADPVLDRRRHHTGDAGEGRVLLRVPEHPLQRRLRWGHILSMEFWFFFFSAKSLVIFCVSVPQFRALWFLLSFSLLWKDLLPESWSSSSVWATALLGLFFKPCLGTFIYIFFSLFPLSNEEFLLLFASGPGWEPQCTGWLLSGFSTCSSLPWKVCSEWQGWVCTQPVHS